MNKIIDRLGKWGTNNVWDNGKIVMNEYCIVVLNEDFEHAYKKPNEFMMQKIRDYIDMTADYNLTLEIPTVKEIKAGIAELCGRKRDRVMYSFGKDLPKVNARYMLDLIDNLKVTEITYSTPKHPVKFKGKHGIGILLPIASYDENKGYKLVC